MPGDDGSGPDEDEAGPPVRPEPGEADPEEAVPPPEPRTSDRPLQDRQLMTQSDVLEDNGGEAAENGAEQGPDAEDEDHHSSQRSEMTGWAGTLPQALPIEFLTETGRRVYFANDPVAHIVVSFVARSVLANRNRKIAIRVADGAGTLVSLSPETD